MAVQCYDDSTINIVVAIIIIIIIIITQMQRTFEAESELAKAGVHDWKRRGF